MNIIQRFKTLPISSKRLLSIGVILGMFVALPLFVWAVVTQTFLINQKAASGEPEVCIVQDNTVTVTPDNDTVGTCHSIQTAIDIAPSGSTILIKPGDYNVTETINITGKTDLNITGTPGGDIDHTWISFRTEGWGFKIVSLGGVKIQWLHAEGTTPNGLVSIQGGNNFEINHTTLRGVSSHTLDLTNVSEANVDSNDISSSAGAVEISGSSNINILNNKIHNADNAISANGSSYVTITGNIITDNDESGIRVQDMQQLWMVHNTLYNNAHNHSNANPISAFYTSGNITNFTFAQNIIYGNPGPGLNTTGYLTGLNINNNDVFSNNPNFQNIANLAGQDGNISADPLFNYVSNVPTCLQSGSPALYGNQANGEFMGSVGACGTSSSPTPSPTPTPPAICGATCGNNYDCGGFLICNNGLCRNPACTENPYCNCAISTPSPSPTPDTITCQQGSSISDNFNDNGQSTVPNPSIWESATNVYLATDSGTLNMYSDNGVDSPYALHTLKAVTGDFQIETDIKRFDANPINVNDLATAELKAYHDDSNYFTVRWVKWKDNTGVHSQINLLSALPGQSEQGQGVDLPLTATPTLKLVRVGGQTKGYYNTGNGYLELPAITNQVYTGPVKPTLFIYKRGSDGTHVVFDNFKLSCVSPNTSPTSTPVPGDINGDGKVNIVDIGIIVDNYRSINPTNPLADLNHDGVVNIVDIGIVVDNYQ